jgi:Tau95 Triple barrel domain
MTKKAAASSNAGASTSAAAGPSGRTKANASTAKPGAAASASNSDQDIVVTSVKRGRGRPKGSKNQYTKSEWLSTKSGVHIPQDEMDRNVEILQARLETSALLNSLRNNPPATAAAESAKGKGKEKAQAPAERTAPVQQLPNRNILSIEYPGFIPPPSHLHSQAQTDDAAATTSSLDKALATLSPLPPPLGTPESALKHIAWVVDGGAEAIECRLGAPFFPLKSTPQAADSIQEESTRPDDDAGPIAEDEGGILEEDRVLSQAAALDPHLPSAGPSGLRRPNGTASRLARDEEPTFAGPLEVADDFVLGSSLYKASIVGSVTSTNNPVVRIRRRKWRRKNKEEGSKPAEWTNKEYVVELVGTSQQTARFRYMADYAYEPEVGHVHLSKEAVIQANLPPGMSIRDEAWKGAEASKAANSNRQGADDDAMDVEVDPALLPAASNQPGKEKDAREKFREQMQAFTGGMHGTVLRKKPNGWPSTANKTLALHAALMTMNTKALRAFKFDPELQDWEKDVPAASAQGTSAVAPSTTKKSNLNLLPPSRFNQPSVAYPYL